jgi:hypothetical protein
MVPCKTHLITFHCSIKIITVLVDNSQIVASFWAVRIKMQSQLIHYHSLHTRLSKNQLVVTNRVFFRIQMT